MRPPLCDGCEKPAKTGCTYIGGVWLCDDCLSRTPAKDHRGPRTDPSLDLLCELFLVEPRALAMAVATLRRWYQQERKRLSNKGGSRG